MGGVLFGALEGTRTPDLLVRSQSLYPAELQAHSLLKTFDILSYNICKIKSFFKKFLRDYHPIFNFLMLFLQIYGMMVKIEKGGSICLAIL